MSFDTVDDVVVAEVLVVVEGLVVAVAVDVSMDMNCRKPPPSSSLFNCRRRVDEVSCGCPRSFSFRFPTSLLPAAPTRARISLVGILDNWALLVVTSRNTIKASFMVARLMSL